jgi:hypothetical protein
VRLEIEAFRILSLSVFLSFFKLFSNSLSHKPFLSLSLSVCFLPKITLTSGALWLAVEPLTALCLLVELNTLFLTLKNLKRAPTVQQVSRLVRSLFVLPKKR